MDKKRERFLRFHRRSVEETSACAEYVKEWWPEELAHRLRIADEVTEQIFLFDLPWDMEQTTVPVTFDKEIDWQYQPGNDPEFIYQMNRHRYWVCLGQAYAVTGNETYAECFVRQMLHWIAANPITDETRPTTWRTIEAGLRAGAWIKSMGYMIHSPAVTDEVFEAFWSALVLHGEYLAACDVPFSIKSNWGVLENSGLYAIGKLLEDEQMEYGFAELAKSRLWKQIRTQVMDDGVHWEQSPMYHNEVLKCFMEVLQVADCYGDEVLPEMRNRIHKMAYANRIWQKPDGSQPATGDSDVTDLRDVLTICAYWFQDPVLKSGGFEIMDFEGIWDYGMKALQIYQDLDSINPADTLFWLKESGNWYLRSDWGNRADYLHVRCGSLGGGHGHIDKLHLDLTIGGEDFLIDPGRYTYVDSRQRRELKGSRQHNSLLVDQGDYSICLDSWDVAGLPLSINGYCCRKDLYTLIQCGHLGYISQGIFLNRRILAIGTKLILVMDEAYGTGTHTYEQNFHIPSQINLKPAGQGRMLEGWDHDVLACCLTEGAEIAEGECGISRYYNQIEKGRNLSFRLTASGNTGIITAFIGAKKNDKKHIAVTSVKIESPVTKRVLKSNEAEGILIQYGEERYLVVTAHTDAGSDCEYIGACGCYGLGRVMAADLNEQEPEMNVLLW
ncbi:MAG: heparinase II/III family protein [Lachnospiraceae bacterium]